MNPIEPRLHKNAHLVLFGEGQAEYKTLPASVDNDGVVMTEWEPDAAELHKLFCGGRVRLWIWTFGHKLQPLNLEVVPPDCGMPGQK